MRHHTLSVASVTLLILISSSHAQQTQLVERAEQLPVHSYTIPAAPSAVVRDDTAVAPLADAARALALTGASGTAQQSEPTRVRASESVTHQISGGETHEFGVALDARQALSQEDWTPLAIPPYGIPWSVMPSSSVTRDLWSAFDPTNPLEPKTARRHVDSILRPGKSRPASESVGEFLGRPFDLASWRRWLEGG